MTETAAVAAPSSPTELRDWLRVLKTESGASFAEIARSIGEDERTVKRWMPENGESVVPRGDALLKLLDFFGVRLTPPAPSSVSTSLVGELRAIRNEIVHGKSTTFTDQEREIITAVARGLSTTELAAQLDVTVEAARKKVARTLREVQERVEAGSSSARLADPSPIDPLLEELEAKVDAQGEAMTKALRSLAAEVRKLGRQLADEAPQAKRKRASH